jgi:iron(III) transport system ATP-binding protein
MPLPNPITAPTPAAPTARRPGSATPPALALAGIRHAFDGVLAVAEANIEVAAGEVLALVGPSGCGKSTLLRLAAGLEAVQQGTVAINGAIVAGAESSLPPERRGIGMVFQDLALFPHLTVRANVRFGIGRSGGAGQESDVGGLLDRLGIAALADAYPHTLSGGQQQRVALARALAPRPRILMLDEPFSSLDQPLRQQIRDDTQAVLRERGVATVIVTHDPEEALAMADRIAFMRAGRIIQTGTPHDIYFHPVDAFVAGFFGSVNRLRGVVADGAVDSPFGLVPAAHLAEGAAAEILVRPEAVRFDASDGAGPAARVRSSRILGHNMVVELALADGRWRDTVVSANVLSQHLPDEGALVRLGLEEGGVFVFPDPAKN